MVVIGGKENPTDIIYKGTPMNKAYVGDKLVWEKGGGGGDLGFKAILTLRNGKEHRIECNDSTVLTQDEVRDKVGFEEITDIVIGDCVTELEDKSLIFGGFSGYMVSSVTLSDTVEKIGDYNFYGTKIKTIDLKNVREIGYMSFEYCEELYEVNFGSVESIGNYAFYGCDKLYDIVLPSSVKQIGSDSFVNEPTKNEGKVGDLINKNRKVRLYAEEPPTVTSAVIFDFAGTKTDATYPIYVPDESLEKYKKAAYWYLYKDRIRPMSEYV